MTPTEQIAWHRSEADRIEAEERARRPALAPGQVWRSGDTQILVCQHWADVGRFALVETRTYCVQGTTLTQIPEGWEYLGDLARDVLRVVPHIAEGMRELGPDEEVIEGDMVTHSGRDDLINQNWWKNFPGCTPRKARTMGEGDDYSDIRFFRKVHPDPPAPQVAPEPTGADLVGRKCWFRDYQNSEWIGPRRLMSIRDAEYRYGCDAGLFYGMVKPYVEGVAP